MGEARRDPGLQPERTRLAWRRTTLTCAVACGLGARQALQDGARPGPLLVMSLIALGWAAFWGAAHRRISALDTPRPPALSPRAAMVAAGCTVALAVFGAAVLL